MKAGDTVIKDLANLEWTEEFTDKYVADFSFIDDYRQEVQRICETQAEISFKAGMEYGNKEAYESGVYNGYTDGVAAGIKEVIPYAEKFLEMSRHGDTIDGELYDAYKEQWQQKLKEWGINAL